MAKKHLAAKARNEVESPRASVGQHAGIMVLGMHRSGTSAITRVLNLLGADLGNALMPAQEGVNEAGFWEHLAVVELNERLLKWHHTQWFSIEPINVANMTEGLVGDSIAEARLLLRREFGESRLWAIKDPRLSLLAPIWVQAMDAEGVEAKFIIAVRHPGEVAASLETRDALTRSHSLLLWGRYVAEAVKATAGRPRSVCDYSSLLGDWSSETERISRDLSLDWPVAAHEAATSIEQFLRPDARHHRAALDEPGGDALSHAVGEMYRVLLALAGGQSEWRELDVAIQNFEQVSTTMAPAMHELLEHVWLHADRARQAEQRLLTMATDEKGTSLILHSELRREVKTSLKEALGEIGQHNQEKSAGLQAELEGRDALVRELRALIAEKETRLETAGHTQGQQNAAISELREHAGALENAREKLRSELQGYLVQVAALREELQGKKSLVEELRALNAEKETRLETAGHTLRQRDAAIKEFRQHASGLEAVRNQLRGELQAEQMESTRLRADLVGRDGLVAELRAVIAEKATRLETAGHALAERDAALAGLGKHAQGLESVRTELEAGLKAARLQIMENQAQLADERMISTERGLALQSLQCRAHELERAAAMLAEVHDSTSWRLTRPLRWTVEVLRGKKKS